LSGLKRKEAAVKFDKEQLFLEMAEKKWRDSLFHFSAGDRPSARAALRLARGLTHDANEARRARMREGAEYQKPRVMAHPGPKENISPESLRPQYIPDGEKGQA
jgi:hypothetical protein